MAKEKTVPTATGVAWKSFRQMSRKKNRKCKSHKVTTGRNGEENAKGEDDENYTHSGGRGIEIVYDHIKNQDGEHINTERDDDDDLMMEP